MGLFNKTETSDTLFEKFNALTDEEREAFIGKIVPHKEPSAVVAENAEQAPEVSGDVQTQPEQHQPNESFEDVFKRLIAEQQAENDKKFEALAKAIEDRNMPKTESKPFGLAEGSKEYSATNREKETSKDLIKKLFS